MIKKKLVQKVKKTTELSKKEMLELVNLINLVFYEEQKTIPKKVTEENLLQKYTNNCKKYSYHGLTFTNNKITSCYSVIPKEYYFFNKKYVFGLAVDTLSHPLHRGRISEFKYMALKVYDKLLEENIPFVFGFPNKNIRKLRQKVLKWKDISSLTLYVNINSILNLKFFENKILKKIYNLIFKLYFFLSKSLFIFDSGEVIIREIFENKNDFYLDLQTINYSFIHKKHKINVNYKIYSDMQIEGNATILYLKNINPISKRNLTFAIKKLLILHREVEIIIYASNLNFFIKNLLPIPKKISPINFKAQGLILNSKEIDERIFDQNNWMLDFSNFDVR